VRVLDRVSEQRSDVACTIFGHVNRSHDEFAYQGKVAGCAHVYCNSLGRDYLHPPNSQVPGDHESGRGCERLMDVERVDEQVLPSQDAFIEIMPTRAGGSDCARILQAALPALSPAGMGDECLGTVRVENPPRLMLFARWEAG